jgi:hypothetical protein
VVADIACALKDVDPEQRLLIGQPESQTQWWKMSDSAIARAGVLEACKLTPLPPIDPCEPYGRVRGWPIIGKWLAALLFPEGAKKCSVPPQTSCKADPTRSWCAEPPVVITPEPKATKVLHKIGKPGFRGQTEDNIGPEATKLKNWFSVLKSKESIKRIVIMVRAKDEDLAQQRFAVLSKFLAEQLLEQETIPATIERSSLPLEAGDDSTITLYFESGVESKDPADL